MLAKNMTPSDQFQSLVAQLEGTIKSAQANVDQAKVQLSYTQIRAPISGVTGLRQVDVGNMVYAAADATPIVVITQLRPIAVLFDVPQDILPQLQARIREGASLTAEAWDRNMNKKYATGFLSAVDNQIDTRTGMVKLKATFSNNDGVLFPNEFVILRLLMTR
jgi:multidrug efflux system membrane fusion protein